MGATLRSGASARLDGRLAGMATLIGSTVLFGLNGAGGTDGRARVGGGGFVSGAVCIR
ncbi:MAG: hypothetical protein ACKOCM_09480 [Cyanobacteriota bacterium]